MCLSVLKLQGIFFDKIQYIQHEKIDFSPEYIYKFQRKIARNEDNSFTVTLGCVIQEKSNDSIHIDISINGQFSFSEKVEKEEQEELITKNAMAILFPYLRAEISILTAQPGIPPVVLPAFNINQLFEKSKDTHHTA